jgi:ATP-dependent Clp protease ATP-binding subunit ClpA
MDRLIPPDLIAKLATLGDCLRANILGQGEVIGDVESLLRGSLCNLRFPGQPTSMLFLGATGVGKTETVLYLPNISLVLPRKSSFAWT